MVCSIIGNHIDKRSYLYTCYSAQLEHQTCYNNKIDEVPHTVSHTTRTHAHSVSAANLILPYFKGNPIIFDYTNFTKNVSVIETRKRKEPTEREKTK